MAGDSAIVPVAGEGDKKQNAPRKKAKKGYFKARARRSVDKKRAGKRKVDEDVTPKKEEIDEEQQKVVKKMKISEKVTKDTTEESEDRKIVVDEAEGGKEKKISSEDKKIVVDEAEGGKKKKKARDFISQCKPQELFEVISSLSDRQREDVVNIGFGGLLTFSIESSFPMDMVRRLVKIFNGTSRMLRFDNFAFAVTADDIQDVFLVPGGNCQAVEELNRGDSVVFMDELKKNYGIDSDSLVPSLRTVLSTLSDGGDDFKRVFVIYCLSVFLTPRSNRKVDLNCIKCLADVNRIGEYDWCSYILKKLCVGVNKYNENPSARYVSGCVIVLLILYFHRMKWQGNAEPSSLPLISHWDAKKLKKRMKEEISVGGLGQGEWVTETYPVSSRRKVDAEKKRGEKEPDKETDESNEDDEEEIEKESDEKKKERTKKEQPDDCMENPSDFINLKLPRGDELSDDEVHRMARDNVHEAFLLFRRNFNVLTRYHMEMFNNLKNEGKQEKKTASSSQSPVTESQKFFSDVKLHEYIDKVVENFERMKNLANEMPNFELLTPEDATEADIEKYGDEIHREFFSQDEGVSGESDERVSGEAEEKGEPWPVAEGAIFHCQFMKKNKDVLEHMSRKEKDIVDYCFFTHKRMMESNVFAHDGAHYIAFDAISTLNPSKLIHVSIIDIWVVLLNKDPRASNCFYFNAQHSLYLENLFKKVGDQDNSQNVRGCWNNMILSGNYKDLRNVDLIFVPVCYVQHYFCTVINFVDRKVHYLDNMVHHEDVAADFADLAKLVQREMSIFLKEQQHPKGEEVDGYVFDNVPFPWQSNLKNIDCGVFLMHHMENFRGSVYTEPNLCLPQQRRMLRASYCSRIVLHRLNEMRVQMEKDVLLFRATKEKKNKRMF